MLNMTNKTFFVTGGGRGIGQAIVKKLADAGAQVGFSFASNEASAQAVLESLPGTGHFIVPLQLQNPEIIFDEVPLIFREKGSGTRQLMENFINNTITRGIEFAIRKDPKSAELFRPKELENLASHQKSFVDSLKEHGNKFGKGGGPKIF